MNNIFRVEDSSADLNKLRYDLSLIYAKSKFEEAIKSKKFDDTETQFSKAARTLDESNFLLEQFGDAYCELANMPDDYFKHAISPTYESAE